MEKLKQCVPVVAPEIFGPAHSRWYKQACKWNLKLPSHWQPHLPKCSSGSLSCTHKWAISLHCHIPCTLNCVCNLTGTQIKFVQWLKEEKASSSLLLLGNFLLGHNVFQRLLFPCQPPQCIPRLLLFWSNELWVTGRFKLSLGSAWMGSWGGD